MKKWLGKFLAGLSVVALLLSPAGVAEDMAVEIEDSGEIIVDGTADVPIALLPEDMVLDIGEDSAPIADDPSTPDADAAANVSRKSLKLGIGETYVVGIKKATYASSSKAVASVSKKGIITAKKKGSARITVKSGKKTIGIVNVAVLAAPKKLTLSKAKLKIVVGETYSLKAKLPRKTASKITWSSNNTKVAAVNASGVVTALKPGKATITAKTFNQKKATCTVTVCRDDATIDAHSPASEIRAMQKKLVILGLLPSDGVTGKYDSRTKKAVMRFQARVNELAGYEVLEVTGIMDAQSQAFLDYYVQEYEKMLKATPTPTPTPVPEPELTLEPGEVVNVSSPTEQILAVQRLLIAIGMLPEGSDDGIYGSSTVLAVADFQAWVNERRKEQTLSVTGEVDQLTLLYLQYCKAQGLWPRG